MTNREIEMRLKKAVENCTPDILERIMADCVTKKGEVIVMTKKNNTNKGLVKKIASVAAALVIVAVGAGLGYSYYQSANTVASTVSFDVNPSIELELNKKANVIEANALNADGEKVLETLKLKGTDANTATSAIIGSLLQNGYIDELANSILISVEDTDDARGAKLQQALTAEATKAIENASANAAIIAQHMNADEYAEVATQLNISSGKAALIERIIKSNPTYTEKDLAAMSVNELNLILSNPKNEVKEIETSGKASEKEYIGAEKAIQIVIEHFGFKDYESSAKYIVEVDFDNENGKLVYEVEIEAIGKGEYEVNIDAVTGEIISKQSAPSASAAEPNTQNANDISKEKAKEIALTKANLKASEVENLKVTREYDDGVLEYKVKFTKGTKVYEYEINAATGKITDFDIDSKYEDVFDPDTDDDDDDDDDIPAVNSNNTTADSGDIGKAKAKEIALNKAGAKESKVKLLRVERDYDDGRLEYSVEFKFDGKEYEYEIDGATGAILDSSVERYFGLD